jgi:hypothetical protein
MNIAFIGLHDPVDDPVVSEYITAGTFLIHVVSDKYLYIYDHESRMVGYSSYKYGSPYNFGGYSMLFTTTDISRYDTLCKEVEKFIFRYDNMHYRPMNGSTRLYADITNGVIDNGIKLNPSIPYYSLKMSRVAEAECCAIRGDNMDDYMYMVKYYIRSFTRFLKGQNRGIDGVMVGVEIIGDSLVLHYDGQKM